VDHDESRAQIAAAAVVAIDELGLDRVRLVDVAKRASCTTGAVRHYFPDKDAVLGVATSIPDAQQLAVSVVAALDGLGLRTALEPEESPSDRLRSMLVYQLAPLLRADRSVNDFPITPRNQEISA